MAGEEIVLTIKTLKRMLNLKIQVLNDDINSKEWLKLAEDSGSFEWLSSEEEDIYSIKDGEEAVWPSDS